MTQQLQTLYDKLESEYYTEGYTLLFSADFANVPDEDQHYARYEYFALSRFEKCGFDEQIAEAKNAIIEYFSHRVNKANNAHLKARYYHFLLYVTHNNTYASDATKYYREIIPHYISMEKQCNRAIYFANNLEKIISLCSTYKLAEDDIRQQIMQLLCDNDISVRIKTFILEIAAKNEHKFFSIKHISGYPERAMELVALDNDVDLQERLLEAAITLSKKSANSKSYQLANEMLGDLKYTQIQPIDKVNIAISFLNENHYNEIINCYKKAKCNDKERKAIGEFEENKKHHRYIPIQSEKQTRNAQQRAYIYNMQLNSLLDNTPELFILLLCCDNGHLLFPPYDHIVDVAQSTDNQFLFAKLLTPQLKDMNNNTISVNADDFYKHEHYRSICGDFSLPFIVDALSRAISEKKISYALVRQTLTKYAFGMTHSVHRSGESVEYSWFSMIDIGLKEFFKQFYRAIDGKQTDWRFTIDFLAPKFEAILRDIVELAGGTTTRVKESGDSELMTLENIIDSPALKEIFNNDDIFLFQHAFTKGGQNIRNYVAHGMLKPLDYTMSKAILVFVCIIRLNKVTLWLAKTRDNTTN